MLNYQKVLNVHPIACFSWWTRFFSTWHLVPGSLASFMLNDVIKCVFCSWWQQYTLVLILWLLWMMLSNVEWSYNVLDVKQYLTAYESIIVIVISTLLFYGCSGCNQTQIERLRIVVTHIMILYRQIVWMCIPTLLGERYIDQILVWNNHNLCLFVLFTWTVS